MTRLAAPSTFSLPFHPLSLSNVLHNLALKFLYKLTISQWVSPSFYASPISSTSRGHDAKSSITRTENADTREPIPRDTEDDVNILLGFPLKSHSPAHFPVYLGERSWRDEHLIVCRAKRSNTREHLRVLGFQIRDNASELLLLGTPRETRGSLI